MRRPNTDGACYEADLSVVTEVFPAASAISPSSNYPPFALHGSMTMNDVK